MSGYSITGMVIQPHLFHLNFPMINYADPIILEWIKNKAQLAFLNINSLCSSYGSFLSPPRSA